MQRLIDAYSGALLYRRLTRTKPGTFFALLTDADDELNYYAVQHLQPYLERKGFTTAEIICGRELQSQVERIVGNRYTINCLPENSIRQLRSYVLLKVTNAYVPLIENIRLISLKHCNSGIELYDAIGFFDKEYIVWNRLLSRGRTTDRLVRTVPFEQAQI